MIIHICWITFSAAPPSCPQALKVAHTILSHIHIIGCNYDLIDIAGISSFTQMWWIILPVGRTCSMVGRWAIPQHLKKLFLNESKFKNGKCKTQTLSLLRMGLYSQNTLFWSSTLIQQKCIHKQNGTQPMIRENNQWYFFWLFLYFHFFFIFNFRKFINVIIFSGSNKWHDPKKFCALIGNWTPVSCYLGEHHNC